MLSVFILYIVLCFSIGWAARMDGGGPPITHEWFERVLVMSPVVAFGSLLPYGLLLSFVGVVGKLLGHGQFFLDRAIIATSPERIDFILVPFFGKDPRTTDEFKEFRSGMMDEYNHMQLQKRMIEYGMDKLYIRNVTGMAIGGLIVTLPLAILLMSNGHVISAIIAAVAGAQKGLAYIIGYKLKEEKMLENFPMYLSVDTEVAEFLNGFMMTALLGAAWVAM